MTLYSIWQMICTEVKFLNDFHQRERDIFKLLILNFAVLGVSLHKQMRDD